MLHYIQLSVEVDQHVSLKLQFFFNRNQCALQILQCQVKDSVNMCCIILSSLQRLAGATLLVFANKQDLPGALSKEAIREVSLPLALVPVLIQILDIRL